MLQHGGQTIAFRPILTVQTQGKTAVADRVLVRFQPGLTSTDLATIQQKATAPGAGAAHPLAQFAPNDWIVDV